MAAQSAAMAQAFGTYFQYGKRKISSMSNEEFNKLTPQIMHEGLTADIRQMIPSLAKSMHTYDSSMTPQIIKEFAEIAKSAISESTTQVVGGITSGVELGVETSKTQINEFLAALTAWMAGMSQTQGQFTQTTVQEQDISVTDIALEIKKDKIPTPIEEGPTIEEKLELAGTVAQFRTPLEKQYDQYIVTKQQFAKKYYSELTIYNNTKRQMDAQKTVGILASTKKAWALTLSSLLKKVEKAKQSYKNWMTLQKNLKNYFINQDIAGTLPFLK